MEKISIQFSEFDFQVYHNYCLRYYAILDSTRKRAVHLFLELFEKELLPVGEHDLGDARVFFSRRCDELLADYGVPGKNNASADLPEVQVCREMPFIIEDFEKIYRIIEKTGIASNYLLLLATFSKIVGEEKDTYISSINEHDRKKAESAAPAIADTIRTRLGANPGWESVLYELTRIIRKYNLVSPDQKINQNCIYLIGPAVVSRFDADIGYEEIQSTLERYIEERELAAFESRLDNRLYLPDLDTDTDTSDTLIFEVLKSISCGNVDQAYYEPVPDSGHPGTMDLPAVISPSEATQNSGIVPFPGRTDASYPIRLQKNYPSRFAIDVSNSLKSQVVVPEKRVDPSYYGDTKPGIHQISLMFMGVVILILFVITMAATSGMWNPVKPVANTSPGLNSTELNSILSIVENLQRNSTLAAKNDQAAYLRSPPVSATATVQPVVTKPGITSAAINKHFFTVAFGPDNTKIKKLAPENPLLSMALTGNYGDNDTLLLQQFIVQFNNFSSTDKFRSDLKSEDKASIVIIFSPESTLENVADLGGMVISKDPKSGVIHYLHVIETTQFVSQDVIYINSDLKGDTRTHWILRGLLDDLGFTGETYDYPDSIFYAGSENTTRLSDIDWKAVQLMYGSKITPGLTSDRVKALLPG
jgi:hypothetical protein